MSQSESAPPAGTDADQTLQPPVNAHPANDLVDFTPSGTAINIAVPETQDFTPPSDGKDLVATKFRLLSEADEASILKFVGEHLELAEGRSLWLRLASAIRCAVAHGDMTPGTAVPSIRAISRILDISKTTVLRAIIYLTEEGLLEARRGVRTFVANVPAGLPRECVHGRMETEPTVQSFYQLLRANSAESVGMSPELYEDVLMHAPEISHDTSVWVPPGEKRKLRQLISSWESDVLESMGTGQPSRASQSLSRHIAHWLGAAKGVVCDPAEVMIFNGTREALNAISATLFNEQTSFLTEEPGSLQARTILSQHGAMPVPVSVDNAGIVVSELFAREERLLYCNPSCQFPTGVVMPASRRLQIGEWARQRNGIVIEEDNVGEFRYETRGFLPISFFVPAHVVSVYGFGSLLGPAWRFAVLVAPQQLREKISQAAIAGPSSLVTAFLSRILEGGHLERRVETVSQLLQRRRATLLQALSEIPKGMATFTPARGGTIQTIWLSSAVDDARLVSVCRKRGALISAVSPYYARAPRSPGVMIDFGASDREELLKTASIFIEVLKEHHG